MPNCINYTAQALKNHYICDAISTVQTTQPFKRFGVRLEHDKERNTMRESHLILTFFC